MKKILKKSLVFLIIFVWLFSDLAPFLETNIASAVENDATVEVVGGGGGGGLATTGGGGGGGGEYRRCTETLSVQSYTVTVGVGGTADTANKTDSTFSGTGITMTAVGGTGTSGNGAGTAGTGGVSTNCDTAVANFNGGTPAAGNTGVDAGGGAGGGAGYAGKGGDGAAATASIGGGGGGGAGESAAGNNASGATKGTGGTGGGGDGGNAGPSTNTNGSPGVGGTPATYHIVGGGGGGGGTGATNAQGGACGAPGGGSGGGEGAGAGNGCRGEIRIIYVDSEVAATGGTETTNGIYRIHTFTTSGTFQVTSITVLTVAPTVTTNTETGVTSFSAILQGEITATGGVNATERGFAWGTVSTLSGGDTSTSTVTGDFGTGTFSQWITNLLAGKRYYYRAYATNSVGTSYGAIDFLDTSAASSSTTRRARLFNGYRIKLVNGRFIIHQN